MTDDERKNIIEYAKQIYITNNGFNFKKINQNGYFGVLHDRYRIHVLKGAVSRIGFEKGSP